MKKSLILFSLLILLIVSFVGGTRFNQHGASQNTIDTEEHKILHYVDPMNPANTSKEPGIAPCGMPMEPVYADEDRLDGSGVSGSALTTSLGTVKINTQKQQIIGVQIDDVTKETEVSKIRALGRIVPDENKTYALVAATDGWMGEIHESTTGSLVSKNQLMGKIRVYNYDFFTWQQRYLTELGNSGRRTVFLSNTSGAEEQMKETVAARKKAGAILPDIGGPIAFPSKTPEKAAEDTLHEGTGNPSVSTPWGIPPGANQYGESPEKPNQAGSLAPSEDQSDTPMDQHQKMMMPMAADSTNVPSLPSGPVPELPTGPVPDLPTGPSPEMPSMDTPAPEMSQDQNQVLPMNMPAKQMPATIKADGQKPSHAPTQMNLPQTNNAAAPHHSEMTMARMEDKSTKPATDHAKHLKDMAKEKKGRLFFVGEDDILYASKARQELLDFGVVESQLAQLAKTGVYFTSVELRSPVDGLVLSRNVTSDQEVNRGTECFRVSNLSRVWVETDIYDLEAKYIRPGMAAEVSLPNMAKRFAATVSEVLPEYDATKRSLKVRLEMDNPEYIFRPNMFVDVEFLVDLPQSISIPAGAMIDSGKRKTVYVVTGEGIFEPREVITGWKFNNRVEIIKGLNLGEKIVVSGNFLIDSESRMKLAAARLMDDTIENTSEDSKSKFPEPQQLPITKENQVMKSTVKDPVCGMNIDPNKAIEEGLTIEAEGKTYYFCSEECALEFHRHGPQPEESTDTDQMPEMSHDLGKQADSHNHMDMGHKP